jgi:hypothetical protein
LEQHEIIKKIKTLGCSAFFWGQIFSLWQQKKTLGELCKGCLCKKKKKRENFAIFLGEKSHLTTYRQ